MGQILPFVPGVVFDDADTRIMGEAFDAVCELSRPRLPFRVRSENIVFCRHYRMARESAIHAGHLRA